MIESIGVAGDWHGNQGWGRLRLLDFADRGIKKIVHLGDFGLYDDNSGKKYRRKLNKILETYDMELYVTLGNHENYVLVSMLTPIQTGENKGWLFDPRFPHIMYASRGFRWEWDGVRFVSLGGANSINRYQLRENISWWSGEQINYNDVTKTVNGGYADVFIAHDCPDGVPLFGDRKAGKEWDDKDIEYAVKSREKLRIAVDAVKPKLLMHGHYHFLADYVTELTDSENENYSLHSVGFNKDGDENNIAVLGLKELNLTFVEYDVKAVRAG